MQIVKKTPWHSLCAGKMAKGCIQCVQGRKLVLFITGLCGQRCFYCPISEQKFGHDVVFANEWQVTSPHDPSELFKEVQLTQAKGAGITGGDPLVKTDRCCFYIKSLKRKFGSSFHIHLYTPLKLVNKKRLDKLAAAGLDEIRFHPNFDDDSLWDNLKLARNYDWDVGIEIPLIPGYGDKIKRLIDVAKEWVTFINLNELERSDTAALHYKLDELGYVQKNNISYGIKGSQELAPGLLRYAHKHGLQVYFCSAKLKDSVQMANRLKLRLQNVKLPSDQETSEGLLRRGCVYLPELAPGVGYRRRLQGADREVILKQLEEALGVVSKFMRATLDAQKLRLLANQKEIRKYKERLKNLHLVPAIVEEYPTADGLEVTVDLL